MTATRAFLGCRRARVLFVASTTRCPVVHRRAEALLRSPPRQFRVDDRRFRRLLLLLWASQRSPRLLLHLGLDIRFKLPTTSSFATLRIRPFHISSPPRLPPLPLALSPSPPPLHRGFLIFLLFLLWLLGLDFSSHSGRLGLDELAHAFEPSAHGRRCRRSHRRRRLLLHLLGIERPIPVVRARLASSTTRGTNHFRLPAARDVERRIVQVAEHVFFVVIILGVGRATNGTEGGLASDGISLDGGLGSGRSGWRGGGSRSSSAGRGTFARSRGGEWGIGGGREGASAAMRLLGWRGVFDGRWRGGRRLGARRRLFRLSGRGATSVSGRGGGRARARSLLSLLLPVTSARMAMRSGRRRR